MTKAMPVLDGKFCSSSMVASNPPAEPPTPTIGQPTDFFCAFALLGCARACPRWWVPRLEAAGALPRSTPSLPLVLRFGAMILYREINGFRASKPEPECSANSHKCLFQVIRIGCRASVGKRRRCAVNETVENSSDSFRADSYF